MLGDTQKVLKGLQEAGYQVVESAIEVDHDGDGGARRKKSYETGWRIMTAESRCVGVVIPTPAPRRVLGKTLCFGEPWFHTEPEAVEQEYGWDAAHAAARVLGRVGRGGVFHQDKVWHAGSGNGVASILRNGGRKHQ
jgi:hypothetical protein